ncbi:unnamed protein product [Parajaminaea phylloscopi]
MLTTSVSNFLSHVVGIPAAPQHDLPATVPAFSNQARGAASEQKPSSRTAYSHLVRIDHDGNPTFVKYKKTERFQDVCII